MLFVPWNSSSRLHHVFFPSSQVVTTAPAVGKRTVPQVASPETKPGEWPPPQPSWLHRSSDGEGVGTLAVISAPGSPAGRVLASEVIGRCWGGAGADCQVCLFPAEFRSRQASMGACSSSLFPPLDSSGPPAPFPGEPGLGTTPSAPLGAPQAGEVVVQHWRCWELVLVPPIEKWRHEDAYLGYHGQ